MEKYRKLSSSDSNLLSGSIIKSLTRNSINSVTEFLQENSEKISKITGLSLPQVLTLRSNILEKYSAPVLSGTYVFDQLFRSNRLPSGISSLDNIIQGGFPCRFITEICGLAGCGTSQLTMQISINTAKDISNSVLYIDTKADFSAIRVQKILEATGCSHKDMVSIMSRIHIVYVWKMDRLVLLLEKLCSKAVVIKNLVVIIIDSLPSLMFQYLGDECKTGLSLLNEFTNKCNRLCRLLNINIICVNVQSRWIDKEIADIEEQEGSNVGKEVFVERKFRCLGKYWQYIPSLVLQIEKLPVDSNSDNTNETTVLATIIKSNYTKTNLSCNMNISDFGVR